MSQTLSYIIQINSNFDKVNANFNKFSNNVQTGIDKIQKKFNSVSMNAFIQNVNAAADGLVSMNDPGMKLNSSLAELRAITGVTGEGLKQIESYARENAKTFGGSAADGVESYKLLLSQLTPELAKQPKALKAMGDNVSILSKQMGGDNAAAAEVLTTAMNQYGVSLDDPIRASKDMASMMNIMSKSAADGSAELPQIKSALEQSGLAAKTANVSFAETNAAIQVLDKAGKKGAEGGVALRNVMTTLSEGRFLPKEVRAELQSAGVDINALGDQSKTLKERLDPLNKIMNDQALVTKLFGKENSAAAIALIQGRNSMETMTKSVQGSNDAYRQAEEVMKSQEEKNKRLQAQIDNFKISLFNGTNGWLGYANVIGNTARDFSNMMPIIQGVGSIFSTVTSATKLQALWTGIVSSATTVWTGVQSAFNAVMAMNPIAMVVIAIAALIAIVTYCWNTFEGFRLVIFKGWEALKLFGSVIKDYVVERLKGLLSGISGIGKALFQFFSGDWKKAWETGKQAASDLVGFDAGKNAANKFKTGWSGAMANGQKLSDAYNETKAKSKGITTATIPGTDFGKGGNSAGANAGSDKMKKSNEAVATGGTKHNYITIKIEQLNGLRADNVSGGTETAKQAGEGIADELLRVLAMASTATG